MSCESSITLFFPNTSITELENVNDYIYLGTPSITTFALLLFSFLFGTSETPLSKRFHMLRRFGLGFLLLIINAVLAFISFFTTSQLSCKNIDENIKTGVQYGALGACSVHAFINLSFMILQPTNIFVVFISFLDACLGVGIVVLDVIVRREYTDFNNRLPEIQILISCLAIGTLLQRSGTRRLINKYKVNPKVRETVRPMNVQVNRPSSSFEIDGGDRRVIATYSP